MHSQKRCWVDEAIQGTNIYKAKFKENVINYSYKVTFLYILSKLDQVIEIIKNIRSWKYAHWNCMFVNVWLCICIYINLYY